MPFGRYDIVWAGSLLGAVSVNPEAAGLLAVGAWFLARVLLELGKSVLEQRRKPTGPRCDRCHGLREVNMDGSWVWCPACSGSPSATE